MHDRLLIFDCDGTLVDSEYLCNRGLEILLAERGVVEPAQALLDRYRGGKLADILADVCARHGGVLGADFVERYRTLVAQLFDAELQPVQGVLEAMSSLGGYRKCVASSGPMKKIEQALRLTKLHEHFEGRLFSSYDVGSWKPEPGLFVHASNACGVAFENCVVIEDSLLGIEAASRAGMRSVLYNPDRRLDSGCATAVIEDMASLPSALLRLW